MQPWAGEKVVNGLGTNLNDKYTSINTSLH
jgi:hypothetical protein